MLQSQLFPKTKKEAPKDAESINHKLLVRAGFMDQLMAGSWTLLPMGWKVVTKINEIIREEINAIGGQEMLMPLLHPKSIWGETGRWDKANEIMYKLKDIHDKEFVLSFTHEEIVMDLLRKTIKSYKDLPVSVYHFSTKFRNELRAKSGILRGREFMMKDLYSAHVSESDLMEYYDKVKNAYSKIFNRLGFNFCITEASGGVFTDKHTHEFQVISESGEDTIYFCNMCDFGANKEVLDDDLFKKIEGICPKCKRGELSTANSIEVGNIFPLGTWYAEKMGMTFTDVDGKNKPVWFGSYGIGPTRVMGTWVEVSHDEKGIIWSKEISPFQVHLIGLNGKGEDVYKKLLEKNIDCLFDDRDLGAGEKFSDADLIGIPVRLVVSDKTHSASSGQAKIEYKERKSSETKLLDFDEILKLI